jgi:hypothetical protein
MTITTGKTLDQLPFVADAKDLEVYGIKGGEDFRAIVGSAGGIAEHDRLVAVELAQSADMIGFATQSAMNADLAHGEGTLALVTNDSTAANNGTYRKVGASGAGSWVQSADRVTVLEGEMAGVLGGASVSDQQLKAWTEACSYEATSLTRDATGVVINAIVKWPDGSAGTFTATTINTSFNCIDAYTITHAASSRKVTQAVFTRNGAGEVITKPALTVGAI